MLIWMDIHSIFRTSFKYHIRRTTNTHKMADGSEIFETYQKEYETLHESLAEKVTAITTVTGGNLTKPTCPQDITGTDIFPH